MSLPKIQLPLFETTIPSTGKNVKFRAFTVKEEKILLIAQESRDINQISLAIKQIINNCVEGVDVETLAMFDLEYILLNIRAKSVNNVMTFKIKDQSTGQPVELEIDIEDIKLKTNPDHSDRIRIDDENYIFMRYPTLNQIRELATRKGEEALFNIMISCIDKIVSGDQVYLTKEYTVEELAGFVDGLKSSIVAEIQKFFETMPILRYEKKYTNSKGEEKTFVIEGMETFFI